MLEQINEMLEKSPPPLDSPSPPLNYSPVEITPPPPGLLSDDRESIERDLQEIVLMEMAATTEQQRKLQDDEIDEQELNIDDEIEELLSFGRDSKSPEEKNDFELDFELPPPMFESPPPPKPTAEAPKRQTKKGAPPPTKAKPKRPVSSFVEATILSPEELAQERTRSASPRLAARSPPSSPPPKPPSPYEPTVLSRATAVVSPVTQTSSIYDALQPSHASPVSSIYDVLQPSHTSPVSVDTPSPQLLQVDEQSLRSTHITSRTLSPQPPPQIDQQLAHPIHTSIGTPSSQLLDTKPSYATPSPVPSPVPVKSFSPEPQQAVPVKRFSPEPQQAVPVKSFSPEPQQAVPVKSFSPEPQQAVPVKSFSPEPQQAVPVTIETFSEPDGPVTLLPKVDDTPYTFAKETNASIAQSTPSTPSSQPLQVKELGVVTPDNVEIVGNVKIHCVQRTRWTPKGSSTESVPIPEDKNKHLYQQHFTQVWAKATHKDTPPPSKQTSPLKQAVTPTSQQNGFLAPNQNKAATLGPQMRTSPRAAHTVNQRYTQPGNLSNWQLPLERDNRGKSASSRVLYPPQQQQRVPVKKPNWKSQEELRIHKNATTPNGSTEQQWAKSTPGRQQSVPAQSKTKSLPRGSNNDWRINRSSTWSRGGVGQRPVDGQQSAFAIKAKNPYDLCSRCHKPLGPDTVMSIPNLKAQYHAPCFVCRVCRAPLVRSPHNTAVLIKGMHPHCKYCGLTDKGNNL